MAEGDVLETRSNFLVIIQFGLEDFVGCLERIRMTGLRPLLRHDELWETYNFNFQVGMLRRRLLFC